MVDPTPQSIFGGLAALSSLFVQRPSIVDPPGRVYAIPSMELRRPVF
jgi:hypothetical protein